jgi:hypothetical protein
MKSGGVSSTGSPYLLRSLKGDRRRNAQASIFSSKKFDLSWTTQQIDVEKEVLQVEMRRYWISFLGFTADVIIRWVVTVNEASEGKDSALIFSFFFIVIWSTLHVLNMFFFTRKSISDSVFVLEHGYARHWTVRRMINPLHLLQTKDLHSHDNGVDVIRDYRLVRDEHKRKLLILTWYLALGIFVDLPWIILTIFKQLSQNEEGSEGYSALFSNISFITVGISLGIKISRVGAYFDLFRKYRSSKALAVRLLEVCQSEFECASSTSTNKNTEIAVNEAYQLLVNQLSCPPTFLVLALNQSHDCLAAKNALQKLNGVSSLVGGSVCMGVINNGDYYGTEHDQPCASTCGMYGVVDHEGVYIPSIVGLKDVGVDFIADAVATDVKVVLRRAASIQNGTDSETETKLSGLSEDSVRSFRAFHHPGRAPAFVWLHCCMGVEEAVLKGFQKGLGEHIVVVGGSSGDDGDVNLSNMFWLASNKSSSTAAFEYIKGQTAISYSVCYPSVQTYFSFWSGYYPTASTGRITSMEGPRRIATIDGEEALSVYNKWTGGMLGTKGVVKTGEEFILSESVPQPLGKKLGIDDNEEPYFQLIHPVSTREGSVDVAVNLSVGDEVTLMHGTEGSLRTRISRMANHIVKKKCTNFKTGIQGALMIYCGGVAMHVNETGGMQTVANNVEAAMGGKPHLCLFTYGEQGYFHHGVSGHGNLMFSVALFSSTRAFVKVMDIDSGETFVEGTDSFEVLKREHDALGRYCNMLASDSVIDKTIDRSDSFTTN